MRVYGLVVDSGSWLTHKPVETSLVKILWDFSLHSINSYSSNRPDVVVFDYLEEKIYFIEVSCPADVNVPSKEHEKLHKCKPLAHDFHVVYNMTVEIVPVVLDCTGVVSQDCHTYLRHIPGFTNNLLQPFRRLSY